MLVTKKCYEDVLLPTREELIINGFPYGQASQVIPMGDGSIEFLRTKPDIIAFMPQHQGNFDNDNEHFCVFNAPDGNGLLAVWTQSSCEGRGDNHIAFSRSANGIDWEAPKVIAGEKPIAGNKQASWGFPVVNKHGRIYLFYTGDRDYDNDFSGSGPMCCIYSDDCGDTWSDVGEVELPRSKYDNPDRQKHKNWIVWQKTELDNESKPLAFCTLITSRAITPDKRGSWVNSDSRCFFIRFNNLDDNPEPKDISITWLPESEDGITVPNLVYPDISTAQEPSLVKLPDGKLFMIMRTATGFIYYAVSIDNGKTFSRPEILYMEDGNPFEHPLSPCPIYRLHDGRYIILFHNNPGRRLGYNQFQRRWSFNYANFMRNPTYLSVGEFTQDARQPVTFSRPVKLFDTGDIAIGPKKTAEAATYTSLTYLSGNDILWYPDRKYYLLGKILTNEVLERGCGM